MKFTDVINDKDAQEKLEGKTSAYTVRIPKIVKMQLELIANKMEDSVPGVEANLATLTRYAITEYTRKMIAESNKEEININIPINQIQPDDIGRLYKALLEISIMVTLQDAFDEDDKRLLTDDEIKRIAISRNTIDKAIDIVEEIFNENNEDL